MSALRRGEVERSTQIQFMLNRAPFPQSRGYVLKEEGTCCTLRERIGQARSHTTMASGSEAKHASSCEHDRGSFHPDAAGYCRCWPISSFLLQNGINQVRARKPRQRRWALLPQHRFGLRAHAPISTAIHLPPSITTIALGRKRYREQGHPYPRFTFPGHQAPDRRPLYIVHTYSVS